MVDGVISWHHKIGYCSSLGENVYELAYVMAAVLNINGQIRRKLQNCIKQDSMIDEIWLSSEISDWKKYRDFLRSNLERWYLSQD